MTDFFDITKAVITIKDAGTDVKYNVDGVDTATVSKIDIVKEKPLNPKIGEIIAENIIEEYLDDQLIAQRIEDPKFPELVKQNPSWAHPIILNPRTVHKVWNGRSWMSIDLDKPTQMYIFDDVKLAIAAEDAVKEG